MEHSEETRMDIQAKLSQIQISLKYIEENQKMQSEQSKLSNWFSGAMALSAIGIGLLIGGNELAYKIMGGLVAYGGFAIMVVVNRRSGL